jgi:hypothetical protein
MTDLGQKWDGSPATVRVVSRETTSPRTVLGPPPMRDVTPRPNGGYRQYDIQYPPPAEPGRPRGHPQSAHRDDSGTGYSYERTGPRGLSQADTIRQLHHRIADLEDRIAALERNK